MTTPDDAPEAGRDGGPDGGDRLAAVGERIDEAARAADQVARNENIGDEERRTAAATSQLADDVIGHGTGEGAEAAPG